LYFARNDLSDYYQLYLTSQSIGFEIPTSYVGIWENEDDDIRIVIRYSGITINGEAYVITSYDQNDGFVGTLGNITGYMIAPYFTTDKLQVGTMSNNSVVTKISDNPKDEDTKIYEVHYGYYEGTAEDDTKYTILINANGIFINGEKYTITQSSDVSYDGIWQGDVWYLIYDYVDTMALMNSDGSVYIACVITDNPNPGVEIDSAHYGTYVSSNEAYTVVVSSDGITINGEAFVLTEYDELDGYIGMYNGEKCYLSYVDYTDPVAMALFNEDYSLYVMCSLTSTTPDDPDTPEVQPEHVGTYVGSQDGTTYTIVVTEDGITINGDTYTITAYDEYEGYTGTWNNEEWYLQYYTTSMMLLNSDFSVHATCNLSTTPDTPVAVHPEHVGTYVGTAGEVTYT
ncbi:MAG: hypothetical protein K2I77_01830, partial [Anaeroplasmataceae bacterium]|nr:hypothetical protein [Anaeroplasmataceae bacterium]